MAIIESGGCEQVYYESVSWTHLIMIESVWIDTMAYRMSTARVPRSISLCDLPDQSLRRAGALLQF